MITKYSGVAAQLERVVDLTNDAELSPAQIDEILGIPRQPEQWEIDQENRRKLWAKKRARAIKQVAAAIKRGELSILPARDIRCVDCGDYATRWEHRDYDKPLEVEPICTSCNKLRESGKGAPVFSERPEPTWLEPGEGGCDSEMLCCRPRSRRYE